MGAAPAPPTPTGHITNPLDARRRAMPTGLSPRPEISAVINPLRSSQIKRFFLDQTGNEYVVIDSS